MFKKKWIFLIIFFSLIFCCFAQNYDIGQLADYSDYEEDRATDYSDIDYRASNTPDYAEKTLKDLSLYLIRNASSEREKARVIFKWITENVSYDYDKLSSNEWRRKGNLTAVEVLEERKAVCGGYANLYKSLADLAGLNCVRLTGKARGFIFSKDTDTLGHAWNSVKIDGKWRLLDSTWGAGHKDVTTGYFKKKFQPYYFLTPASRMIYTHLPKDDNWQLLNEKVSKEEFYNKASLKSGFFEFGFNPDTISHKDAEIEVDDKVKLEFYGDSDVFMMAHIKKDGVQIPARTSIEGVKGNYTVTAFFPDEGDYNLHIFARRGSRTGSYSQFIHYKVHADSGVDIEEVQSVSPVKPTDAFFNHGFTLDSLSHRNYRNEVDEQFVFTLDGRDDLMLLVKLSQNGSEIEEHTMIESDNGSYEITVDFPSSGIYQLDIYGKNKSSNGQYPHYFKYLVDASDFYREGRSGFPVFYTTYFSNNCRLLEPKKKYLIEGENYDFEIYVPEAEKVAVVIGKKWNQLDSDGSDTFTGSVEINDSKICIYAKFSSGSNYSGLVKFELE
ncbi:hypothetical protein KAJ27_07160 [bacterium]|nr:hypothetical protein [bacterium]